MAVKCLNCDYEMSTYQEVISALSHVVSGIFGSTAGNKGMATGMLGGLMNQKLGTSEGVKCPKCGMVGDGKNNSILLKSAVIGTYFIVVSYIQNVKKNIC